MNAVLDWIEYRRDRVRCRLFNIHGRSCRGRIDHSRHEGRWLR